MPTSDMMNQDEIIIQTIDRMRSAGKGLPEYLPIRKDFCPLPPDEYTVPPEGLLSINPKTDTLKLDQCAIAEYLRDCGFRNCDGLYYRFDGRYYIPITKKDVEQELTNAVRATPGSPMISSTAYRDIVKYWSMIASPNVVECTTSGTPTMQLDELYGGWVIPFENGIYSVENDVLLPFTPSILFRKYIHARYDPSVESKRLDDIYLGIFGDEETLDFFFLAVGYTLYSETLTPPALFLLLGPGETGKSAILEVLETLLGSDNVSNMSLSKLSTQFGVARLKGMAANLCDESGNSSRFSTNRPVDGDLLKAISSGRPWDSEQKFQNIEKYRNEAKLWFASNSIPDFGDNSSGMMRRLHIFPCTKKQDPGAMIYNEMCSPEGLAWLAFKALKAFIAFRWEGKMEFEDSSRMKGMGEAFGTQDSVMEYIDHVVVDGGYKDKEAVRNYFDGKTVSDEYNKFKEFLSDAGRQNVLSRKNFRDRIILEYGMISKKVNVWSTVGGTSVMQFKKE